MCVVVCIAAARTPTEVAFDVWKAGGDMAGGHDTASVPAEVAHIVKGGHQAILANGNDRNWYLNDGYGNSDLVLWNTVYDLEPLNGTAEFDLVRHTRHTRHATSSPPLRL